MTNDISRRSILARATAGAAASAMMPTAGAVRSAAAAMAGGGASAAITTPADAELFAIEKIFEAAVKRREAAAPAQERAERAMIEWRERNPQPICRDFVQAPAPYGDRTVAWLQSVYAAATEEERAQLLLDDPNADEREARREYEKAITAWVQREAAAEIECGLREAVGEYCDADEDVLMLIDQAAAIPATTLAGLQCKARMSIEQADEKMTMSILNDLHAFNEVT
jgi:hypothetical protein